METKMTLGKLLNNIEGCPWIYCGDELLFSPYDKIYSGSYEAYLKSFKIDKFEVSNVFEEKDFMGENIIHVDLDPTYEGCITSAKKIFDNAVDLIFEFDMTKKQALAISLIDLGKVSKVNVARLLETSPQSLTSIYEQGKNRIENSIDPYLKGKKIDTIEDFRRKLREIPEKEGFEINVQTNDINGWSILTREEALNSRNLPGGLNGTTTAFYHKQNEWGSEKIFSMELPYSFDRKEVDSEDNESDEDESDTYEV